MKEHQYQKVYQQLRQDILTGKYKNGDLLPSENVLAATFGITRVTVRQALEKLVKEGYILKQQGKGSIVQSERQSLGLLSFRGFSEVVRNSQHQVKTIFLQEPVITTFPEPFFYELEDSTKSNRVVFI